MEENWNINGAMVQIPIDAQDVAPLQKYVKY